MESKLSSAEINFQALAFLYGHDGWYNIREIGRNISSSQNPERLKKVLDDFVKRGFLQSWDLLNEDEKRLEQKTQLDEIRRKNNYKITQKGREKFEKIRNDCLDADTKIILRIREKTDEENQ